MYMFCLLVNIFVVMQNPLVWYSQVISVCDQCTDEMLMSY
jgi:hypothetical protein